MRLSSGSNAKCGVENMEHERAHIDMDELMARGFTVVPGFVDAETCRRARAVIDDTLGDDPTAAKPPSRAQITRRRTPSARSRTRTTRWR